MKTFPQWVKCLPAKRDYLLKAVSQQGKQWGDRKKERNEKWLHPYKVSMSFIFVRDGGRSIQK